LLLLILFALLVIFLGDIHHKIIERESAVVQKLTEEILHVANDLIDISSLISELDW
jgi:hypothetical protein